MARGSLKVSRKGMSKRHSKKLFRKTANRTHKKNLKVNSGVMRGGIRM